MCGYHMCIFRFVCHEKNCTDIQAVVGILIVYHMNQHNYSKWLTVWQLTGMEVKVKASHSIYSITLSFAHTCGKQSIIWMVFMCWLLDTV